VSDAYTWKKKIIIYIVIRIIIIILIKQRGAVQQSLKGTTKHGWHTKLVSNNLTSKGATVQLHVRRNTGMRKNMEKIKNSDDQ